MKTGTERHKEKLIRITAWVPQNKLKTLVKDQGGKYSQSEILRWLIDNELERIRSLKAHEELYGAAKPADFDDRLL